MLKEVGKHLGLQPTFPTSPRLAEYMSFCDCFRNVSADPRGGPITNNPNGLENLFYQINATSE